MSFTEFIISYTCGAFAAERGAVISKTYIYKLFYNLYFWFIYMEVL